MRVLRALAGSLLWILAGVVGLVAALLCLTVILLPLGIPLFMLARKLFRFSMTFFLPRAVRHPAQETSKPVTRGLDKLTGRLKKGRGESAKKAAEKTGTSAKSFLRAQRKRVA